VLGKGLDSLLGESKNDYGDKETFIDIDLNIISTNPYQPRKVFNEESIQELADSLIEHGQIQPIVLSNDIDEFIIVAGERRYRAAKLANFKTIKAIVLDIPKTKLREISIIENIQREDLNPIDLASSYGQLIKEYNITHEELSKKVKKSRASITNTLRLLTLSAFATEQLSNGKITLGHAKTLVSLVPEEQNRLVGNIISEDINVREQERIVREIKKRPLQPKNSFSISKEVSKDIKNYCENKNISVQISGSKIIFNISSEENINNFVDIFLN
jgi:ParB family chromosome partitioning protein